MRCPGFWSDQYDLKLQMVGLSQGFDRCVLRGDPTTRHFSAFYLRDDRLLAVDAVNRPGDFMLAKRALAQPVVVSTDHDLADEGKPPQGCLRGPGGGCGCGSRLMVAASGPATPPALAVHNIQIVYGGAIEAVRDVSLEVRPGQIVALLGSNGAGKSTVLKAVSGVLDAEDGVIEKGSILLHGEAIEREPAPRIVRRGMVQVPERSAPVRDADGRREPSLSAPTCAAAPSLRRAVTRCTRCFRAWPIGANRSRAICPAASSRWWRSDARS